MSNYSGFYNTVYAQDSKVEGTTGWIQWKGTDVCMDINCVCGHHGHVDRDFFYFFECPKCKQRYAVGQNVQFIPLTPELIKLGDIDKDRFITCELEAKEGQ